MSFAFTFIAPKGFVRASVKRERRAKDGLVKAMGKISTQIVKDIKFNASGQILQRRSGRLYNSLGFRIDIAKDEVKSTIGSTRDGSIKYAKIHDTGGMAGRNRSVKIPKRRYALKAIVKNKLFIRRQLKKYLADIK